jgi:hypothetical protein
MYRRIEGYSTADRLKAIEAWSNGQCYAAEYLITENTGSKAGCPTASESLDKRRLRMANLQDSRWKLQGFSDDSKTAFFYSAQQRRRVGAFATLWVRYEYHDRAKTSDMAPFSYLSSVSKLEFDCVKQVSRTSSSTYYTVNDMKGDSSSYQTQEKHLTWDDIVPGTIGDAIRRVACTTAP